MKILITGGIGFIGTNTAIHFSKNKKNKITIIDNFSRIGVKKNAIFLKKNFSNITIIKARIEQTNKFLKELSKADVVIHLAGQTAVTKSILTPGQDFKDNLWGGFSLLEAIRKHNRDVVAIYASTNKVYGTLENHSLKVNKKEKRWQDICHQDGLDENEKINFISPYGCSKGSIDLYFQDYARIYNLKTVIFRQSCVYGPFQMGVEDQGWLAHFTKCFLLKKPITIFGDGYQVRDLLYVQDLIKAYELAVINAHKIQGQVFNIGGGVSNSYSLLQVIDIVKKEVKNDIQIYFEKVRQGDQKFFVSSNRKISEVLNWKLKTSLKTGMKSLIDWQKNFFGVL